MCGTGPACTNGDHCASGGAMMNGGCGTICCGVSKPCPVSLRKYKRDIRYLDEAERERLRGELLRFPLATWKYRNEGDAATDRLGFIIDDVAPSPSVAADGQTVDLYGYTTMTVATVQQQQREIDELRAELKALKQELSKRRRATK